MARRQPIANDEKDEPDRLILDGPGEFKGRPDGKISGRGMLGLVSAIPPAPKIPNIKGVRMLAPTVMSDRPGPMPTPEAEAEAAPLGLPDDTLGDDLAPEPTRSKRKRRNTGEVLTQQVEGKPAWIVIAVLVAIVVALATIPVVHEALSGPSATEASP